MRDLHSSCDKTISKQQISFNHLFVVNILFKCASKKKGKKERKKKQKPFHVNDPVISLNKKIVIRLV